MTARRPLGWLLIAFLALSVAAMHTGITGSCTDHPTSGVPWRRPPRP